MKSLFILSTLLCLTINTTLNYQENIGKTLININLKDSEDRKAMIPFFGQKVLAIFYNDPDSKDVNDPLSDAIKAHKFSKESYQGIGIANCIDTWLPNSVIRYAAREKEKKYPGSVVLIDDGGLVSKAWGLTNCDDSGYIIIVGKDMKVKYIKQIKNQEESKSIINIAIKTIEDEILKIK